MATCIVFWDWVGPIDELNWQEKTSLHWRKLTNFFWPYYQVGFNTEYIKYCSLRSIKLLRKNVCQIYTHLALYINRHSSKNVNISTSENKLTVKQRRICDFASITSITICWKKIFEQAVGKENVEFGSLVIQSALVPH